MDGLVHYVGAKVLFGCVFGVWYKWYIQDEIMFSICDDISGQYKTSLAHLLHYIIERYLVTKCPKWQAFCWDFRSDIWPSIITELHQALY